MVRKVIFERIEPLKPVGCLKLCWKKKRVPVTTGTWAAA
jgi:hypothetical protein